MRMDIVGIDPGLANTGIGWLKISEHGKSIPKILSYDWTVINTSASLPVEERLAILYDNIYEGFVKRSVELIVVEDIFLKYQNAKTEIMLSMAMGAVLVAAKKANPKMIDKIPAREIRKILTGNGGATKEQVEKTVRHILEAEEKIKPDHASDALAVAIAGLYRHFWKG